ncbi:MAG: hypothetical protein Q8P57_03210 [Candidatus Pacearchaeota archaeon]|nr:hypothetical protein [Candidatus Pacearchaeota archaeon]
MDVQKAKSHIKKLAEKFDLKYNPNWFKHLWISVRHEILTEYIGNCPDPIYQKYGKTAKQKIKNIDKFVNSKDFQNCLKRYGGQVSQKSELKQEEKWIKKIDNEELRNELLKFHEELKNQFGETDFLALLTIPRNEKEKEWQMRFCLRHEWIHILLDKNKIQFQEIAKKYWPYDEGINEYMGAYLDGTLNKFEKFRDKEDYPMEKKYWVYAIKLRELLKDKKTSEERKKALLDLISDLKRRAHA